MKAAVYVKPDKIEIKNINKPVLTDSGAIIKVYGCGLCGSDIIKFKESLVSSDTVLGHEVVGEIVEIKSGNEKFKIGEKIALGHHVPCYNCVYCRGKSYSMCKNFKRSNIIPGGFTEYIYVSPAHLSNTVFKIENELSDVEASFMEPAACCLRAVKRANIMPGDNVLVVGLGSIGLIMGQIAKHFGASVIGVDLLDERIELAKEIGFKEAYKYINPEKIIDYCKLETNYAGIDKVFLTSGSLNSLPLSVLCVRDGGTITVFASVPSHEGIFFNNDIYYRELTIMGSYSPSPEDLHDSLNLLKNSIIKVKKFITVYNLDNIKQAISDTLSNRIIKAFIKL